MAKDLENLLGSGENIVLETRQHPFILVRDTGVLVLVLLLLLGVTWYVSGADWLDNTAGDWIAKLLIVVLAVDAVLALWKVLGWWTERFYITTSKVVYARGILNRNVTSTPLVKIDEVTLKRPFIGRMLGFGRLDVENASGGSEPLAGLEYLPRPMEIYQMVTERGRHQRMVEGGAHRDDDNDGFVDANKPAPRTDSAGGWNPPGDSTST